MPLTESRSVGFGAAGSAAAPTKEPRLATATVLPAPAPWPRVATVAAWALVLLGALLRLPALMGARCLWGDEAMLALNVIERSWRGLCHPLRWSQGAPVLFLWIEHGMYRCLGDGERALRLFPWGASIAALLLFYALARRCLSHRAGLAGLAILALSKNLVFYAGELKQYSSDVAASMAVLLCAAMVWRAATTNVRAVRVMAVLLFALALTVLTWLSHPAVFVIAGVGVVLAGALWRDGHHRYAIAAGSAALLAVGSATLQYLLFARYLVHDPYLMSYWQEGMMPWGSPLEMGQWLFFAVLHSADLPVGTTGRWPMMGLFLAGIITLVRTGRARILALLVLPAGLALLAAAVHRYPYSGRLSLFLVPLQAVVLAAGFDGLRRRLPPRWRTAIPAILLGGLLLEPAYHPLRLHFRREQKEEIKPVLAHLQEHRQDGDVIYVQYLARAAVEFYGPRYQIPRDDPSLIPGAAGDGYDFYLRDLSRAAGHRRAWILRLERDDGQQRDILPAMQAVGTPLAEDFHARGVHLHLYDLSKR